MKTYSYEAKAVDGVPTLSDLDIDVILHYGIERKIQLTKEYILEHLETLRGIYADHIKPKPIITSDHAPCMGFGGKCGSTDFIRTGTCYVCFSCGTSAGCS